MSDEQLLRRYLSSVVDAIGDGPAELTEDERDELARFLSDLVALRNYLLRNAPQQQRLPRARG